MLSQLFDLDFDEQEEYRWRWSLSREVTERHRQLRRLLAERGGFLPDNLEEFVEALRERGVTTEISTVRRDLEFLKQTAHR